MLCLDQVGRPLRHNINRSRRVTSRDPTQQITGNQSGNPQISKGIYSRWGHTRINDSQSTNAIDLQLFIHNPSVFPLRHARGAGGVIRRVHPLPHELFNFYPCGFEEVMF